MNVVGLVAAAGQSARMGRCKALLPLQDGTPFVVQLARVFLAGGLAPVVITIPDNDDADPVRRALQDLPVLAVPNEAPELGLTGSVQTALTLTAGAPECDGLLLTPVDAPFATVDVVEGLVRALAHGALAAVPVHHGTPGHPVAFARALFARLLGCGPRGGPASLLQELGQDVVYLPCDDERITWDINAPQDLRHTRR